MNTIRVKPGIGSDGKPLRVLDELNRSIPEKGVVVERTAFILRLINDKDLVVIEEEIKKKKGGK